MISEIGHGGLVGFVWIRDRAEVGADLLSTALAVKAVAASITLGPRD